MSDNIIIESGTIRLTDAIWAKARHRAGVISSIAEEKSVSKVIATEAAQKLELSERTVYRLCHLSKRSSADYASNLINSF